MRENQKNKIVVMPEIQKPFETARSEHLFYTQSLEEISRIEKEIQEEENNLTDDERAELEADMHVNAEAMINIHEEQEKEIRRKPNRKKLRRFQEIQESAKMLAANGLMDVIIETNEKGEGRIRLRFAFFRVTDGQETQRILLMDLIGECSNMQIHVLPESERSNYLNCCNEGGKPGNQIVEIQLWYQLYDIVKK